MNVFDYSNLNLITLTKFFIHGVMGLFFNY
jgi:hypothetical protein